MGFNAYLADVESFGYKAQSATATALTQNITGKPGKRIAIRAFGFRCANVATTLNFLQVLATTTVNGAVASGLTTVTFASLEIGGTVTAGGVGTLVANDNVVVVLDNGVYQFTTISATAGTAVVLADALQDTLASGNTAYGLGVRTDSGPLKYLLTVSTQNTKELDGGIFYGEAKGYPMIVDHLNASATALASLDYLTVGYINK